MQKRKKMRRRQLSLWSMQAIRRPSSPNSQGSFSEENLTSPPGPDAADGKWGRPAPIAERAKPQPPREEEEEQGVLWSKLPWWPNKHQSFRERLFIIFDDPTKSRMSLIFVAISATLVIVSAIALIVQSLPRYRYPHHGRGEFEEPREFVVIEIICTAFFTVEYIVRVACAGSLSDYQLYGKYMPHRKSTRGQCGCSASAMRRFTRTKDFVLSPLNVIDLVSILPFYLELLFGRGTNLTFLRVLRLLRVARIVRHNKYLPLLINVVSLSASMLGQVAILLGLFIVFAASVMFLCEMGSYNSDTGKFERFNQFGDREESPFDSVFIGIWWTVVTFTTVGYGEIVPTTIPGRILGCMIMMLSLVLFALPISIVTSVFVVEHQKMLLASNDRSLADETTGLFKLSSLEGRRLTLLLREEAKTVIKEFKRYTPWFPTRTTGWRENFFLLFEEFHSCRLAAVVHTVVLVSIVLSSVSMCIESLPEYRYPNYGSDEGDVAPLFVTIEVSCASIFGVELLSRMIGLCAVTPGRFRECGYRLEKGARRRDMVWVWFTSPMTLIDFCSTIPTYLEQMSLSVPSLTFVRILRLMRMGRVLRLIKQLSGIVILSDAISNSLRTITKMGFFFVVWIILCSSVIYACEEGRWDEQRGYYARSNYGTTEETPYVSILSSMWWMVVTMTTVGFGDMYPTSTEGRILAIVIMFFSIICVAVPICVVGEELLRSARNFTHQTRESTRSAGAEDIALHTNSSPTEEFFNSVSYTTSRVDFWLKDLRGLIDYHSFDPTSNTSELIRSITNANLGLSPASLEFASGKIKSMQERLNQVNRALRKLKTRQAKMLCYYAEEGQRTTEFFKGIMQRRVNAKVCFIAWAVYSRRRRNQNDRMAAPGRIGGDNTRRGSVATVGSNSDLLDSKEALVGATKRNQREARRPKALEPIEMSTHGQRDPLPLGESPRSDALTPGPTAVEPHPLGISTAEEGD